VSVDEAPLCPACSHPIFPGTCHRPVGNLRQTCRVYSLDGDDEPPAAFDPPREWTPEVDRT